MNQTPRAEARIETAKRRGISWAWLFPLLALAATAWLFWSNWKSQGPMIQIRFEEAPGIQTGKTVLFYRGVQAGRVRDVHLDARMSSVVVSVRLEAFASELASEGAQFWIDQPVLSLRRVAGIESIIQGNSIMARMKPGDFPAAHQFEGLPEAPLIAVAEKELELNLEASSVPFVGEDSPLLHKGVQVGWVRQKVLSGEKAVLRVSVEENHQGLVNENTRFWVVPATELSTSPGSIQLKIPALSGLIDGAVAFDTFAPGGNPVADGHSFELSPTLAAAKADGPSFVLRIRDAEGLRAGETRICYLGQPVGIVESVSVAPGSDHVVATARLEKGFSRLATVGSRFEIVRPRLSLNAIEGLDTLVTGPYVAFHPGNPGEISADFVATSKGHEPWEDDPGEPGPFLVTLEAVQVSSLRAGAPVFYRGMMVGKILEKSPAEGGRVRLVARLAAEVREHVHAGTRFWRVPATSVEAGPGVLELQVQGLVALLQGGVAFESFNTPEAQSSKTPSEFLLYDNAFAASAVSDPVRIRFANGQGLQAGKTQLRYLGLPAGLVEAVSVSDGSVEVVARFLDGFDFLRKTGSQFAIVRPTISLQGVSGLETLMSGVYIECVPGDGPGFSSRFTAVETDKPALLEVQGLKVQLVTESTTAIPGTPITYNDNPIGEVVNKTLSRDGKTTTLGVRIFPEHEHLIRDNTVFWDASKLDAKIGFFKLRITTPNIVAPGRIACITRSPMGSAVSSGHNFPLAKKPPPRPW